MPLWMSSRELESGSCGAWSYDFAIDLSGDVALQTADRFSARVCFGDASLNVGLGSVIKALIPRERRQDRIAREVYAAAHCVWTRARRPASRPTRS